jgi:hypothetical protein
LRFIEGFVFGAIVMMSPRLKGAWRWICFLVFAPLAAGVVGLLVMLFFDPVNPPLEHENGIYISGAVFAVLMMLSGFTKPNRMPRWVKWAAVVALVLALASALMPPSDDGKKLYTFTEEMGQAIKAFSVSDKPIDENVVVEGEGWSVDCHQPQTYRLFEVPNPGVETGMVNFSATLISQNLKGRVYVEMIYRMPDGSEHSVKALDSAMTATNVLSSSKARRVFKQGEKPVQAQPGRGRTWQDFVQVR